MTSTELLAAIRASRLSSVSICDLAILSLLSSRGPTTGAPEIAAAVAYSLFTANQSLTRLESSHYIHIDHAGRPLPITARITPLGAYTLGRILAGLTTKTTTAALP